MHVQMKHFLAHLQDICILAGVKYICTSYNSQSRDQLNLVRIDILKNALFVYVDVF